MNEAISVVIDTHALIWYFEESSRLSAGAKSAIDLLDADNGIGFIPVIVLAEILHITEKRRTSLQFAEVIERIANSEKLAVVPLDLQLLIRAQSLTPLELHDRIIVATALSLQAKLITRDRAVRDSRLVECIW